MEIITVRRHRAAAAAAPASKAADPYAGSPDADYMKNCREVDLNPPATWKAYDMESPAGVKRVIEMEYRELMAAATPAETEENIYHLSVALLRYWRLRHEHANGSGDKSGATK